MAITTVIVFAWIIDHAGRKRIAFDIAGTLEQILIRDNEWILVSTTISGFWYLLCHNEPTVQYFRLY